MVRKVSDEQREQNVAREQRKELKEELAAHYASRPRKSIRHRRVIFLVLGAIGLLAVIFSLLAFWPAPAQTPAGGVPIGTAPPNFNLPVYGGGGIGSTMSLASLRGHPVVLNFYSESCQPCLAEVPYLERVYKSNDGNGQFALLGINQSDPKEDIRTFGSQYGVTYPLLFDEGGNINQQYGVTAIPTTYFIDSHGVVRSVVIQPLTPATMKQGLASIGIALP
ncbi:MAG TPA: TlpA disulfide reductase family protein [Ktedonobacteraceae bacterium]|nr:TlpA disulfide reductase family protein [Ktedonobacteraceae bacterium]